MCYRSMDEGVNMMTRDDQHAGVPVCVNGDLVGDGLIKLPFVRALSADDAASGLPAPE